MAIYSKVQSGLSSLKTLRPYLAPRDSAIAMSCLPGYGAPGKSLADSELEVTIASLEFDTELFFFLIQ